MLARLITMSNREKRAGYAAHAGDTMAASNHDATLGEMRHHGINTIEAEIAWWKQHACGAFRASQCVANHCGQHLGAGVAPWRVQCTLGQGFPEMFHKTSRCSFVVKPIGGVSMRDVPPVAYQCP